MDHNKNWSFRFGIWVTVFPHIVCSLEYFPPLNSFPTLVRKLFKFSLHRRKANEETIWISKGFTIWKRNSCRGNYIRKYGTYGEIKAMRNCLPPWSGPKCLVVISQVLIAFQQMRIKTWDLGYAYELWRNWDTDNFFFIFTFLNMCLNQTLKLHLKN